MKLPDYVTVSEVKRVCKELGLRDWSKINPKKPGITVSEGKTILKNLDTSGLKIDVK